MSSRSWTIILCGGMILAIALGFRQSLGLFSKSISADLGIGRESFALGLGLTNLFWGIGAPFTGAIADRYGSVAILVISGILYASGLAVMALSGTGDLLVIGGTVLGFAMSGVGFSVILGVVARSAPTNKQGLALGIASTFGSIGQCAALPYTHVIIEQYGWSQALLVLAACSLVIVPLAFGLMTNSAKSAADGNDSPIQASHTMMQALAEARQSPSFWLLNAGFFVCGFQVVFIAVHLPSYLTDKGFTMLFATVALTLIGLGNIIGSFFCGVLGDIYSRKYLLSGLYLARSIIIIAFILLPISSTSIIIFSFTIGLLWLGTVPLTSGLVAKIYGTTFMSTLFGIVFFSHQLGSFFGAWLAGRLFDMTGNYDTMWWAAIGFGVVSSLLHWPISEEPIERQASVIQ